MGKDIGDENFGPGFSLRIKHAQIRHGDERSGSLAQRYLRQITLMRVTNDTGDPRQGRNLLRRSLRVTSGNHDLAVRILAQSAADSCPRVLFGGGGNRTGVENDPFSGSRVTGPFQASFSELLLDGRAIRLSGPTAEIFYVKTCHRTILAYIHCPNAPWGLQTEDLRSTYAAQNFVGR